MIDLTNPLIDAIGAIWLALSAVGVGYLSDVKKTRDACLTRQTERDKADGDALAAYRRKDEELIRLLQQQGVKPPGAGG